MPDSNEQELLLEETEVVLNCLGTIYVMLDKGDTVSAYHSIETMRMLTKNPLVIEALDAFQKVSEKTEALEVVMLRLKLSHKIIPHAVTSVGFDKWADRLCELVNNRERKQFFRGMLQDVVDGKSSPEDAATKLAEYRDVTVSNQVTAMTAMALAETSTEMKWVVDRLIPTGSVVFVAGDAGSGKSMLCLDLALKFSSEGVQGSQRYWLDQFKLSGGKVVYLDLENAQCLTAQRLRDLGMIGTEQLWFLNQKIMDIPIFDLCDRSVASAVRKQLDLIGVGENDIIIFDTIRACHLGDENDSGVAQMVMSAIGSMTKATKICLHHLRKGEGGILTRLRGSSAFGGAADLVLGVSTTGSGDGKVSTIEPGKTRGGPEIEKIEVNWITHMMSLAFTTKIDKGTLDGRSKPIIELMKREGRKMAMNEIQKMIGYGKEATFVSVEYLIQNGIVQREIVGKKTWYTVI